MAQDGPKTAQDGPQMANPTVLGTTWGQLGGDLGPTWGELVRLGANLGTQGAIGGTPIGKYAFESRFTVFRAWKGVPSSAELSRKL